MNFMQLITSLDELLYEVMSWLVFYPVTLWRAIRHPWVMMEYADVELADKAEEQYLDTLSPPLFLLLTLLLAHGVELALIGDSTIVQSHRRLAALISDDTNLIVLRLIGFAVFPLVTATWLVRRRRVKLDRNSLKLPFYSQCYVTAPLALVFSLAATLSQCHWHWAPGVALAMSAAGALWYLVLQTGWFASHLGISRLPAFGHAIGSYAVALVTLGVVAPLFA